MLSEPCSRTLKSTTCLTATGIRLPLAWRPSQCPCSWTANTSRPYQSKSERTSTSRGRRWSGRGCMTACRLMWVLTAAEIPDYWVPDIKIAVIFEIAVIFYIYIWNSCDIFFSVMDSSDCLLVLLQFDLQRMMIYCDSKHAELETCCDLPNGPVSQMPNTSYT